MGGKVVFYGTFVLIFSLNSIYAQQANTAAGGNSFSSKGSASYSIGQIVYTANVGSNGTILQGVQQPYEISTTSGLNKNLTNYNLSLYPNPTAKYLILNVDAYDKASFFQLLDINGKVLDSKPVESNHTTITVEQYSAGTYFLKLILKNLEVETFKITKN
jgi:hypothetical protein